MLRLIVTLSTLLAVSALADPQLVEPSEKSSLGPVSNAVTVRFGMGSPVVVAFAGLGGIGSFAPEAGFSYEHAFGHLSLVASIGGSTATSNTTQSFSGTFEPGLRWTFGDERLSGPWVGAHVPLSFASGRASFVSEAGTTSFESTTLGIGADALAGWTFRLGEAFMAQAAFGPRVQLSRATASTNVLSGTGSATSLGLRGFVSAGAVF